MEWSVCTLLDISLVGTTGQACQSTGVDCTGLCVTQVYTHSSLWQSPTEVNGILLHSADVVTVQKETGFVHTH